MDDFDIIQETPGQDEDEFLDLSRIKSAIWGKKYIILSLVFLGFLISYILVKDQIPSYTVSVLLKTDEFSKESDQILNMVRQTEMRSRTFAERVTAKMGLAIELGDDFNREDGELFAEISTSTEPVPGNYKIKFDEEGYYHLYKSENQNPVLIGSEEIRLAVDSTYSINGIFFRFNPDAVMKTKEVDFKVQQFSAAVKKLMGDLSVHFSRTGAFMTIEMQGPDPDILPKQLNQIAKVYVEETLKLTKRDVSKYKNTLERQLKVAEENVKNINSDIRKFNQRYPLTLDAEKKSLSEGLQNSDIALIELPKKIEQLDQLLAQFDNLKKDSSYEFNRRLIVRQIASASAMSDQPVLNILRETLLSREKEYDDMVKEYSVDYPNVKELAKEITATQNSIIDFTRKFHHELIVEENETRTKMNALQAHLKSLPNDEIQLIELERKKKINVDQHAMLYSAMNKIQISELSKEDKITILDKAIRPLSSNGMGKKEKLLIGGGLGFMLGLLLSVVLELTNKNIRTVKDVEKFLKVNVLGAIPQIDFKYIPEYNDFDKIRHIDNQLSIKDYASNPINESYRALRTSLMFSKKTGKIDVLLITSIAPGDGKSFTASNLALIFAHQGKNTLLVDSDLRRGVLHNSFGVKKEPGFSTYLSGDALLFDVVQQSAPNLSIISCGPSMPNPAELLGSLQLKRFIEEARRKFDFIIIDTPPLNAATDSVVLSTQVDAVTVVIRANDTNRDYAKERMEVFQTVPANLIGVILNGTESNIEQNYYSYSNY